MKFKTVSREEFEAYARSYGRPLAEDLCAIGDPPIYTLNDFSDGKVWPESIVAKAHGKSFCGRESDEDHYEVLIP